MVNRLAFKIPDIQVLSISILVCLLVQEAEHRFQTIHSQAELVKYLQKLGVMKSDIVADVMLRVDRGHFVNDSKRTYSDSPIGIGCQASISSPYMHAYALEVLKDHIKPGNKVLDVGSGSGYLTVCMGLMLNNSGLALGIEHMPELVEAARKNIQKSHPELLESGIVKLMVGDGRLGVPMEAPFDAIHVGAAPSTVPEALVEQLKKGGRMLIPVGMENDVQVMTIVDKDINGKVTKASKELVRYVPLTDKDKQWP